MATQNRFPEIKRGTTFNGRDIKFYNGTGVSKTAMDLDGVIIEMKFRSARSNDKFSFTTADNSITKTALGVARMMPRTMAMQKGEYTASLILTFPNGTIKTYTDLIWLIN